MVKKEEKKEGKQEEIPKQTMQGEATPGRSALVKLRTS